MQHTRSTSGQMGMGKRSQYEKKNRDPGAQRGHRNKDRVPQI